MPHFMCTDSTENSSNRFFFYSFQNAAHVVSTADADNPSNQTKLTTIHVAEAARENACQQGDIDLVVASDWLKKWYEGSFSKSQSAAYN